MSNCSLLVTIITTFSVNHLISIETFHGSRVISGLYTPSTTITFAPTYNLRSLNDLENFIKQNKHLPEIAPAKQMQENGVSAGELQMKLLQKVEETTLYLIEQSKQIEILKKDNEKLKNERDIQIEEQLKMNAELRNEIFEMKKEIENLKKNN